MIRHEDIGIQREFVTVLVALEARQICRVIIRTPKCISPLIPTGNDVVESTSKLNAGQTSHAPRIA